MPCGLPAGTTRPCTRQAHSTRTTGRPRERALDVAAVPVLGLGLVDVEAGGERLARGEPGETVEAAVEERGELAAGFAQRPFEQGVVAARQHRRARVQRLRPAGVIRLAPDPGLDQRAREQELAGDPADRDGVLGDQLVDLALLDPEQRGDLPGGQKLGHANRYARGRG